MILHRFNDSDGLWAGKMPLFFRGQGNYAGLAASHSAVPGPEKQRKKARMKNKVFSVRCLLKMSASYFKSRHYYKSTFP